MHHRRARPRPHGRLRHREAKQRVMSERTRRATARRPPGSLSATRMALSEGWRGFCMYGGQASDENASEAGENLGRERLPSPGVSFAAPLPRGPATPIHALLQGAGKLLVCPNSDCINVNDCRSQFIGATDPSACLCVCMSPRPRVPRDVDQNPAVPIHVLCQYRHRARSCMVDECAVVCMTPSMIRKNLQDEACRVGGNA